jgi:hypothetical protein
MIGALALDGLRCLMTIEGATDADLFERRALSGFQSEGRMTSSSSTTLATTSPSEFSTELQLLGPRIAFFLPIRPS